MASIRDLATSIKINVVSVPIEIASKITDPAYLPASIPANTYTGQTDAVPTVVIRNFLVTGESVPAETVYAMTKALFTNLDQMSAAHSAAKSITAADAPKNMPVPLHPGAERYYRQARSITMTVDPDQPVWTDGEYIGRTPVSVDVLQGVLTVVVP